MFGVLLTVRDSVCLDNSAHQMNLNNQSEKLCMCVSVYVCMDIYDLKSTSVYNYKREKNENLKIFMTCIYITKLFTKKLEFNGLP